MKSRYNEHKTSSMSSRRRVSTWKLAHVQGREANFLKMSTMSKKTATDSINAYQTPNITIHVSRKNDPEIWTET